MRTRSKTLRCSLIAISIGLFSGLIYPDRVRAAFVDLNSGDQIPGTDWEVVYSGPMTLKFDATIKTHSTKGTILKTASMGINAGVRESLTISFNQIFETTESAVSGGLRLNFRSVTTNTGPEWSVYGLELVDISPVVSPDDDHPPEPHFHPENPVDFEFGPNVFDNTAIQKWHGSFKGALQRDPSDVITLGNGVMKVATGQTVEVTDLLIHERQFTPGQIGDTGRRFFQLVQTAPEPATFILLGAGLGLLALRRHRRH